MLKSLALLGVGFSLGYAKALHDSGDIKEAIEVFKNDEELRTALKDLGEALKRVKDKEAEDLKKAVDVVAPKPDTP